MSEIGAASGRIPVRSDLEDVVPYGAPQLDVPVRLNTNETAEPPPPGYLEAVAERLQGLALNRYPDREHLALRRALATRHDVGPGQVWAANGSNEVLVQLLQVYGGPGRRALSPRPGYSMYPELSRTTLTEHRTVDLDGGFRLTPQVARDAAATHAPDLVLLPSPNNPVGTTVDHETIRALHDASKALIVVDEAYVEFADPAASVVPLLAELDRLVVVRTFSKAFRLAGLRLGYLIGPAWVVDDVQKVRLPYHLDALTQVAGVVALEQEAAFLEHRGRTATERDRVRAVLQARGDVEVFDSSANFLLLRAPLDGLFDALLAHGVLVRDFSHQPRLERCVRVTIGTPAENDRFLAALDAVLADARSPHLPSERIDP
ncbi:MAG: histidinol-phosphate transaminase [Nitriliruptoraceae bacterium]